METPFTDHLTAEDFNHIYEPAEDTFLLLDALEADLTFLEQLEPTICVEIGSGSGVVITALAKKLRHTLCLATDINPHACVATKSTAKRNQSILGDSINCSLLQALRHKMIDVLIFNPPYVVTTDEELTGKGTAGSFSEAINGSQLVKSWAGGLNGRRIIDELLGVLDSILSPKGVFYLLLLHENKPKEIVRILQKLSFTATIFMERRIPGEHLYILKIKHNNM